MSWTTLEEIYLAIGLFAWSLAVSTGVFETREVFCCESVGCSVGAVVIMPRRKHASPIDAFEEGTVTGKPYNHTCAHAKILSWCVLSPQSLKSHSGAKCKANAHVRQYQAR